MLTNAGRDDQISRVKATGELALHFGHETGIGKLARIEQASDVDVYRIDAAL